MSVRSVIVAGTGQAGFQTAASLRQEGFDGSVLLIGDEPGLPYQRPPLSKDYLKEGEAEKLFLREADFYTSNAIDLEDSARIGRIDRREQCVHLTDGRTFAYDHLVLALGARNRMLPLDGADLDGVVDLRTLHDANLLRDRILNAGHVIVVGGGFIGLEVAATARGLGASVTVLEAMPRLMGRVVYGEMSDYFLAAHASLGTDVRLNARAARIVGDDRGHVAGIELDDGARIAGDLVLIAAGVVPNAELAAEAGLDVDNGIVVDDGLLTSDPTISAIGDCAHFPHARRGATVRLESVQNAVDQARSVAGRIAGKDGAYDAVAWFWSNQGEERLQIAGLTDDANHRVSRFGGDSGKLAVFAFRNDAFIGVETVNAPAEHMAGRRLLALDRPVMLSDFEETDYDLRALLKMQAR